MLRFEEVMKNMATAGGYISLAMSLTSLVLLCMVLAGAIGHQVVTMLILTNILTVVVTFPRKREITARHMTNCYIYDVLMLLFIAHYVML